MQDMIEARLAELRGERDRGEQVLAELQQRQAVLRDTLLRINGAIQVLEELQKADPPEDGSEAESPAPPA
jgi:prefoldin subunit 5